MAENKKGFVLYADQISLFENLNDDEAGRLIIHIFKYVNDLNPEPPDRITQIAFEPIKQQLKRDLKKWEKRADKSRENGRLGGRPIKPKETQETQQVISEPKKPVNVNVNGTVNVNDSVSNTTKRTSITIGQEIFLGKTSEWLMKHKESAIETFMMSNRKFTRDEIFKKLDEETNLYHFKDTNHPYNYFKSVYSRMEKPQQKQEPVRNIKVLS